jgi:transcriptional regulator with GAF, ATPase, and Fis domain
LVEEDESTGKTRIVQKVVEYEKSGINPYNKKRDESDILPDDNSPLAEWLNAKSFEKIITDDIESYHKIKPFRNKEWIDANKFDSYCSIPLFNGEKLLGTMSFYTKYNYVFHSNCFKFLEEIKNLLEKFLINNQIYQQLQNECNHLT